MPEIENLRALDLFREIPGLDDTWFAYHALFRGLARRELRRSFDDAAISSLQREIAPWFAGAGLTREAIQHLVSLVTRAAAAALSRPGRAVEAFAREDWTTVAAWLAQIPDAAVLQNLAAPGRGVGCLPGGTRTRGGAIQQACAPHMILGRGHPAQRAEISLLTNDPGSRSARHDRHRRGRPAADPARPALPHWLCAPVAEHGVDLVRAH
ncbi:MAG: hypothetical protein U0075_14485 [Thermomicrobiales bacterium]